MRFFLDTADPTEIARGFTTGLVHGVTTNPSLAAKQGMAFDQLIQKICESVPGCPVSAEVVAPDAATMITQGRTLWRLNREQVVVKIPLTFAGLEACGVLAREGIRTNVTLCFSAVQAVMAARAGATFISPFVGRLDDIGKDGMALVREIRSLYDRYGLATHILAASIRNPEHVLGAAMAGADYVTLPSAVFWKLLDHPLTAAGLERFNKDWEQSGLKIPLE